MRELTLTFPAPAEPLSMNDKDGRSFGRAKQAWRNTAYFRWVEAHPGVGPRGRRFPPAVVHVSLGFAQQRSRDPINFARTTKAIVDGLVMAGAWPDDTLKWVEQQVPSLRIDSSLTAIVRVVAR